MRIAGSKTVPFRRLAAVALGLALALPAAHAAEQASGETARESRWVALARERLAAVKAEPRNAERMADFGETLLTAGQFDQARKALERARQAGSARAELLLAECALREDYSDNAARAALEVASRGDPQDPRSALLESLAMETLGNVEGALDASVNAAELAESSSGITEELAHRVLDQLERCVHWSQVFSLVE